jgi:GNAT superfamily N-acetyltransferase
MSDETEVKGPLEGQGRQVETLLRGLPHWFGIEQSLIDYARAADELPTFVAYSGETAVGFVTLRRTSVAAMEVHVMAVRQEWHRCGVGRRLLEAAASFARAGGCSLLHVKTLGPSEPDEGYAGTRRFYEATGFIPLEDLPGLWGPRNPCLLLVKPL